MKIRFYIDTAAAERTDKGGSYVHSLVGYFNSAKRSPDFTPRNCSVVLEGLTFYTDEYGIYTEISSFFLGVPQGILEAELPIKLVTLYDEALNGKPALGVYEFEGARAIVDSFTKSGGLKSITYWRINISGEEFDDVVQLYRSFRQGEIKPTECWTDLTPLALENQKLRAQVEKLQQQLTEATA